MEYFSKMVLNFVVLLFAIVGILMGRAQRVEGVRVTNIDLGYQQHPDRKVPCCGPGDYTCCASNF